MASRINLDMDVLRTFVTGFELGSFARAADRLGRSQSAVSTQLRRLEDQVGEPLVQKAGRGLAPTAAGESLLSYAKRILDLNDEAIDALRGANVEGWVRLGLAQDFAETWLPSVLGRFARAHPNVRVEVRVERNVVLMDHLVRGDLDLALNWARATDTPHAEHLADCPIVWIGRPDGVGRQRLAGEPLPLVAFEHPCIFRSAGIAVLDAAGIPWRLAFTSPSVSGLWAAAEAGLGVTLRTRIGMPTSLVALDPGRSGLPALPSIPLALHRSANRPTAAVARLADILREMVAAMRSTARSDIAA